MSTFLAKKISNIEKFILYFRELYDSMENIYKGSKLLADIEEAMSSLKELISTPSTHEGDEKYFFEVSLSRKIDHVVEYLMNLIDAQVANKHDINTILSQTYVSEFYLKKADLYKKISNTSQSLEKIDEESIAAAIEQCYRLPGSLELSNKNSPAFIAAIKKYQNLFRKYTEAVDIYTGIVQKVIDRAGTEHRRLAHDIYNLLEDDKNFVLDSNKPRIISKLVPLFNTFRLIPVTDAFQLEEKFQMTLEELVKKAAADGTDVIVINKQITQPIAYKFINLMKSKPARRGTGLNPIMIRQFETIQPLDAKSKWNFDIDYHTNEKNEHAIILQRLTLGGTGTSTSGGYYKILSNVFTRAVTYDIAAIKVRKASIHTLLQYQSPTTSRSQKYHEFCTQRAIPNMFFPYKPDLSKIDVAGQIADPKYLRNNIFLSIMADYDKLIKTVKHRGDVYKLFASEQYAATFVDNITKDFHEFVARDYVAHKDNVAYAEIFMTLILYLQLHKRNFIKGLNDAIKGIASRLRNEERAEDSRQIFSNMLSELLEKIISNDNNIYAFIGRKVHLSTISLLEV